MGVYFYLADHEKKSVELLGKMGEFDIGYASGFIAKDGKRYELLNDDYDDDTISAYEKGISVKEYKQKNKKPKIKYYCTNHDNKVEMNVDESSTKGGRYSPNMKCPKCGFEYGLMEEQFERYLIEKKESCSRCGRYIGGDDKCRDCGKTLCRGFNSCDDNCIGRCKKCYNLNELKGYFRGGKKEEPEFFGNVIKYVNMKKELNGIRKLIIGVARGGSIISWMKAIDELMVIEETEEVLNFLKDK